MTSESLFENNEYKGWRGGKTTQRDQTVSTTLALLVNNTTLCLKMHRDSHGDNISLGSWLQFVGATLHFRRLERVPRRPDEINGDSQKVPYLRLKPI